MHIADGRPADRLPTRRPPSGAPPRGRLHAALPVVAAGIVFIVGAGLFGPALRPAAARRPPAEAKAAPAAPTPVANEPSGMAALLAAADDITRQVVALRGLEVRRPIARGVLSRDEIGRKLQARIAKEYTPEEIRVESRLLKRLGMLPPDIDYYGLLLSLLQEQVAGFYDPFARQLYIADWLGLELQRPALAHEIQHALQDQHFDLKTWAVPIKDDGDRQLARAALVEGDGTAVMMEFVAQSHGFDVGSLPDTVIEQLGKQISSGAMDQSPIYSKAPRFLRETLLFPYFSGMQFVYALKRTSGWKRVDEAFKSPPDSTEQVLHPEKFLAREHPVAVTAAPIPSLAPRTELRRDVLGELEMRVLFAGKLADAEAERAAAGWGGDRMVVYGDAASDARPVVVINLSTWDTEEDARQAESALRVVMSPGARPTKAGAEPPPAIQERDGESFVVERRDRDLLAIFGVPSEARMQVVDEVWKGWKVAERVVAEGKADVADGKPGKPERKPARGTGKSRAESKKAD